MCSPSQFPFPPPSPPDPSKSSQCTRSEHLSHAHRIHFCVHFKALDEWFSSRDDTSLARGIWQCIKTMQETWVGSLGWEDSLEESMAAHSSILSWRIQWTEEPDGLQSVGSQKSRTWLND